MRSRIFAALLAGPLSACAHGGLMPTAEHRKFSSDAFEYAVLANNAYGQDDEWIDLPDNVTLIAECDNDEIGLAYSIFRRTIDGRSEYVFAFRGTEGFGAEGKKDWKFGNLSLAQQRRSEPIVKDFVAQHKTHAIAFVGHSLGGGLAIHNSMREKGHRVFVFNSSPRFYAPDPYDAKSDNSDRLSIVEKGEVLKAVRIFSKEAWQTYMPFNCFGKGNPIFQHSMVRLAMCLTRIAAGESGTREARRARSIIDNNAWAIDATTHPLAKKRPRAACPTQP